MKERSPVIKVTRRFERAQEQLSPINALPFDALAAAKAISSADKKMAKVIKAVGPCRLELQAMQNPFESLLESIVYQQLTGKAAGTIMGRVKGLYKNKFPSPSQVLKTSDETLRAAGLSGAKTAAIKDLADKTKKGFLPDIDRLHEMTDEDIIDSLTAVRGIGDWTVHMLLIFRLGRPDVMPNNDYGVRKGFAKAFDLAELPSPRALLEYSENWRPYRSVASWYLWRVLDLK